MMLGQRLTFRFADPRSLVRLMASDLRAVRRRTTIIAALLLACLFGLAHRAWQIAVDRHTMYAEQGHRQQLRSYKLDASRGAIVDRSYIALAVNDRVHKIVLNPRLIHAQGHGAKVDSALRELFPDEDPAYFADELARDKSYRQLRMQLDDTSAEQLRERSLPGVTLEPAPQRVYPRKLLGSHLLGRVNAEGEGTVGVEAFMNAYLQGRDATSPAFLAGRRRLLVDGHPDAGISWGHTVVLTIDSGMQAMAEDEIDGLVATWHPVGASIIVLDPENGEVLAMANRPTFDPNHAVGRTEQTVNLAVQAAYEPGSTMKAITVAAALEQGTIRANQTFFCENGRWKYSDRELHDTKPSQWLTVTEILAVSSNICTTKIYETLDKHNLHKWVKKFHFGERPPIQLSGATPGLLADWDKWSDIQAANISFGQGMSASPLQVAAAFAALANAGVYNAPTVVKRVVSTDGKIVMEHKPVRERLVRSSTAKTVLTMLEDVVHDKKGTGRNALIPGYRVAGKTSTAQKAKAERGYHEDQYYASFVGAVPADEPKLVILVSVDNPEGGHYGNEVAAPTFASLGRRLLAHLGVPREDGSVPAPDMIALAATHAKLLEGFIPEIDVEPDLPGGRKVPFTTGVPDFTGLSLSEAYDAAEAAHIRLHAIGSGIAVVQDTPPGSAQSDTVVEVVFESPR